MTTVGPGAPFEFFFEKESDDSTEFLTLPQEIKDIYRGDWRIPMEGQYRYSNFVVSHDGKSSFSIPGHEGGGDISGFNRHDQWIMALCRSRADAVIVGANTLRSEPAHKWTAQFIFPDDAELFDELRGRESRKRFPYQIFVTNSGDLNAEAAVFQDMDLEVLIAAPTKSLDKIQQLGLRNAHIIENGVSRVDLAALHQILEEKFGVKTVLCEGGPKFYGSMIAEKLIDEEFLSISPIMVGSTREEYRPGLIDGIVFPPKNQYSGTLMSVRKADDLLFLRTRFY